MTDQPKRIEFVRRAAIAISLAGGLAVTLAVLWYAGDVFLVIFAGLLFAVFLHGLTQIVRRWTRLPHGGALTLVCIALLLLTLGGFALVAGSVATQVEEFSKQLPKSEEAFRKQLSQYSWGKRLLENMPTAQQLTQQGSSSQVMSRVSRFFSSTLGVVGNFFIILFIGLYVAADPDTYRDGLARLFPPGKRPRCRSVLDAIGEKLWAWLLGRIFCMVVIAVATVLGLWMLGIPAALTLALIAGFLNFIPNIGPVISVVPAALMALTVGPMHVVYVGILYLGIQLVESYLLTPLVQERNVHLAPALIISMQVLLGVLMGVLGLALATPLTAVALVLVQELYVKKLEGDERDIP